MENGECIMIKCMFHSDGTLCRYKSKNCLSKEECDRADSNEKLCRSVQNVKIEPCKICGGRSDLLYLRYPYGIRYLYHIECTECKATTRKYDNPYKAIDEWNNFVSKGNWLTAEE